MQQVGFGRSSPRIHGSIGYFRLEEWWLTAFDDAERHHIQSTFQPMGSSGDSLTTGVIYSTDETAPGLLSTLATWFTRPEDRSIAHRMLDKAWELSPDAPVLDAHFMYQHMIEIYYKDRTDAAYMDRAVSACKDQIALGPRAARAFLAKFPSSPLPGHKGYKQLAIILEKLGRFADAIDLSRQAAAEGWAGDWSNRVERCGKKLRKA